MTAAPLSPAPRRESASAIEGANEVDLSLSRYSVAVALCDCSSRARGRAFTDALSQSLRKALHAAPVEVLTGLCTAPSSLETWFRRTACERLVVVGCDTEKREHFGEALERCGRSRLDVEVVPVMEPGPGDVGSAAATTRNYVLAAVRYLQVRPSVPKNLVGLGDIPQVRRFVARRQLFRGRTRTRAPRVAPRILRDRCSSNHGCRLCIDSCPTHALTLRDQQVEVQPDICEGCGACVAACGCEAVDKPDCDAASLQARMKPLLESAPGGNRSLLLLCPPAQSAVEALRRRGLEFPPELRLLPVPCARLTPASWLLWPLRDGAQCVLINACDSRCRWCREPLHCRPALTVTNTIAAAAGWSLPAVFEVDVLTASGDAIGAQVAAILSEVVERPPTTPRRFAAVGAALHRHSWVVPVSQEPPTPFASVHVDSDDCTLCGACAVACPTAALSTDLPEAGTKRLLFRYSECLACRQCVELCPENAISLRPGFDESRLRAKAPTVLTTDRVVHCKECGRPFATLASLSRVRTVLAAAGQEERGLRQLDYCPDCKLHVLLSPRQGMARTDERTGGVQTP